MKSFREIRWVLVYTMILNLLVTIAKLAVGYTTGTLSLVADGYHSLFDSAANVIGLVGIQIASRPADSTHPYGHRKFETLSAMGISVLLFLTTVQLIESVIERLRNPVVPDVSWWNFGAALLSIVVQIYVATYERRRGEELKSEVLVADAMHTRGDILVSCTVMVGMILVRLGYPLADTLLPLLIAVLIAKIGVDIIRDTSKVLVDRAALDVTRVQEIALDIPGVRLVHNVRSRGQEDDIHLDLHVQVQEGMPVEQAHHIAHQVKRRLVSELEGVQDVIVHVEPARGSRSEATDLDARIREIAGRLLEASVHSIQAHEVEGQLYVTLHLEVGGGLSVARAHELASQLEDMLRAELPGLARADVHLEPADHGEGQAARVDRATYQRAERALYDALQQLPDFSDCHNLTIYRDGEHLLVSVHCRCDASLPLSEAHALSSQLEERLRAELPPLSEVVVHVEPRREAEG